LGVRVTGIETAFRQSPRKLVRKAIGYGRKCRVHSKLAIFPSDSIVTVRDTRDRLRKCQSGPLSSGLRVPIKVRNQKNKKAHEWCLLIVKQRGKDSNLGPPGYEFESYSLYLKSQNSAFQLA
jgi:hypothetical protein